MNRVYVLGMIGLAVAVLLSLIVLKSFPSRGPLELTRIQTSPEVPGGAYPGSENLVLLEFTNRYPGSVFVCLVRTEVLTERGWPVAVTFPAPDRLIRYYPPGFKLDEKKVNLWAPAPPGNQPWRAVVRYRRDPRLGMEEQLDRYGNWVRLRYPRFHDLTTGQISR